MFKRSLSFLMCCCVFLACFSFPVSASSGLPDYTITGDEWDNAWPVIGNVNTNVCLTPGSDESQINFAWHCSLDSDIPTVIVSKSAGMNNAKSFTGVSMPADEGYKTNRVTATGLEPDSVYYYTYGNGDKTFGPYIFRTLATSSFKFLYVNDMHAGYNAADDTVSKNKAFKIHNTVNTALKANPDISFMIAGGDQTDSGQTPAEWNGLLASPIFRSLPIAFAIGNHDKKGVTQKFYVNNPNEFNALLPSPVGKSNWFRYGDVLFLMFDSTNGNAMDHIRFAKQAINKNLDAKWRIGILHNDMNGPSFGFLDLDNNLIRIIYTTIFDRAGLDVVLTGHSHIYGRSHHLQGGKIVDWGFGNRITDPDGTVYISMSAVNNVAGQTLPWQNVWTAKRCRDDITTYSTVAFTADSLQFKAFYDTGEQCDEYTITKTQDNSEPFKEPKGIDLYSIVKLGGFIYTLIDMFNK